ncbi:protein CHUP1, chloroplastic [Dendrobium catenatum]|uniref:Protein CHUP1, chloroplastic n=1 Tax=Dendrobium catenatum TaxID=906689 RepID=A0A2I0VXI3_9ASPA|nr:protein CHUP1, chloroplastic [Dendrobium catenatum]PKU68115.1 Protein CHUP1, chloroplastic [Dendrobium catenatum]
MVAGKVKAVMGLQKSPAAPKLEASRRSSSSPSTFKGVGQLSNGKASVFSRSFGVYFPRSSAQVQPRPPDVADLIRLVEELQEKESRLRTELLEQKILKETVALVPFLEKEVTAKNDELDRIKKGAEGLEAENRVLRMEVAALLAKIREFEEEGRKKEAEIEELKRTVSDQQGELRRLCSGAVEIEDCTSSSRFQGLIDASARSILLKNIRKSSKSTDIASYQEVSKPAVNDGKGEDKEIYQMQQQRDDISKPRPPRVPKPPPLPSTSSYSSTTISEKRNAVPNHASVTSIPAPPPPPPPPPPATAAMKGVKSGATSVRRVPEVVEFYHSFMRRDTKRDSAGGVSDAPPAANVRNMIGEIENRSAHLLAIKTEVETQGDFIRFLIKEVENAAFSNIEDLVSFVKWLDDELSFLVDERAVLKHFDWPEAKSDAMREAAFGYCDLRKLELEASSFRDDPRQPCSYAIKKMQSLLEKLEHGIFNLSRVREGATERYKNFHIPWDWMLDSGIVSQMKLASVKLAMKFMKRVTSEISAIACGPEEEELMLQGVRFAFRVHQFAGGFDVETMRAFQELKDNARKRQANKQNQQQQQKLFHRSTS